MINSIQLYGKLILAGLACAATLQFTAYAAVIDFEGIAAPGTQTTDDGTNRVFSGFNVFTPHGHYQDSAFNPGDRPTNGTDWLLHDHFDATANQPVVITVVGGGVFSLRSVDASEWENTFPLGQTLTITGHVQGGGTIIANLITDNVFGFQPFSFGNAWTNLTQVDLIGSNAFPFGSCSSATVCGSLGYDNVIVEAIPEPTTLSLLVIGLSVMIIRRKPLQKNTRTSRLME